MSNIVCGIDFGTSNSALAIARAGDVSLAQLEGKKTTIPSAIFFNLDEAHTSFGRQAIDEYLDHYSGRFMRSLKSLLGSDLMTEATQVGLKRLSFPEIIGCFIGELKSRAESQIGQELTQVVMGRPVHFVDDNSVADKRAEQELYEIAVAQGFRDVSFEYEPIAAARDYESQIKSEELVLVVDIGGGTSDFSVIRLSPDARLRQDRAGDILANDGVHIGGTDFDKRFSLAQVMPHLGYGTKLKNNLDMPRTEYNMLATWHLINFLYTRKNISAIKSIYADCLQRELVARFIKIVENQKGHELASQIEKAKIELSDHKMAHLDLSFIEEDWSIETHQSDLTLSTGQDVQKIIDTALSTVVNGAGIEANKIDSVFMTGGSTALPGFMNAIQRAFPSSRVIQGDRFSSVATGLGISALRRYF